VYASKDHLHQPSACSHLWAAVVAERLGFKNDEALTYEHVPADYVAQKRQFDSSIIGQFAAEALARERSCEVRGTETRSCWSQAQGFGKRSGPST